MDTEPSESSQSEIKRKSGRLLIGLVVIVSFLGGYRWWGVHEQALLLDREAQLGPHVDVVSTSRSPSERTLTLVGEAHPYASVTLYAKVSGYLKELKVDKGDLVKKDQVLAVIESPEIDKDYQGALADSRNKKSIAGRMNQLRERNLVSPQEADQADSDAEMARSRLESLAVQKGYEVLRAPFAGTVTARYADPGALVQNAANSQTSALPVVTVSQVDSLRVYVYADQRDASYILPGSLATVKLAERPSLELKATVTRVSGELDPKTKMLLTEIDVDNKAGQVVPGSFVQVTLHIQTPTSLQIPVAALSIQQGKTLVPVVDTADLIHYREVQLGENDGKMVTVVSGLTEGERVALNLGSNLADGHHVRPNAPPPAPATPPSAPAASATAAVVPVTPAPAAPPPLPSPMFQPEARPPSPAPAGGPVTSPHPAEK